jgi:hypothetical protein
MLGTLTASATGAKSRKKIEGHAFLQARRHRVGIAGHEQRVAVGGRLRDHDGSDAGACAGPVVDHDRLAEQLGHFVREDAGGEVGDAAAGKTDHQSHRSVGVGRLRRRARAGDGRDKQQ